jgi:endonuclease/exonuclease/phosphatase family metal-dependent hydrolase
MFDKIWSVKKALDKKSPGGAESKFIVLGDLNTMGLQFPLRKKADTRVSEMDEIKALEAIALKQDMVLLPKEFVSTFNNGKFTSNLDHVLATNNVAFRQFGLIQDQPFFVRVTGWQQLQGNARKTFIDTISDHCSLYCEIL